MTRTLDNIDPSYESISIIRNIELERIDGNIDIDMNPINYFNCHPNFWFWMAIWRQQLIKKVCKYGGILTGSKVLKKTKIDGKPILNRSTYYSDFDFLVTEPILYEITSKISFSRKSKSKSGSDIMSYRIVQSDSYGHGGVDVDLIVIDELPMVHNVGDFKYADPIYILKEKYQGYLKKYNSNNSKDRVINEDLEDFFWKFRKFY